VTLDAEAAPHTEYAGVLALYQLWQAMKLPASLQATGIAYSRRVTAAADMAFMLSAQPWLAARSIRQVAQRFGGEPSKDDNLEADALLQDLFAGSYSQRTLSRFVNRTRYDWARFYRTVIARLQQQVPAFQPRPQGVLLLDDFPVPKPYAQEMDYLTTVWDNNLKHQVSGYAVVHYYYYHPKRPGYSLGVRPHLKTSETGETQPKPKGARRRAREGEEHTKLDIALDMLPEIETLISEYEALVFDSWYTARWFIYELSQREVPWVGEVKAHQKFEVAGEYLTVREIYERYRGRLRQLQGFAKGVKAIACDAIQRPDQYTKEPQALRLVLVVGLTKKRDNEKGYHLIATNQRAWTARHITRLFSYRPEIEQVHRRGKQHAGWTTFQTRNFAALQCHFALSLLRSTFLTVLQCVPALRTYSLTELIHHGIQMHAQLARQPAAGTLRVQIPASALAQALATLLDPELDSLLVKVLEFP
jgi:hypothetical protein